MYYSSNLNLGVHPLFKHGFLITLIQIEQEHDYIIPQWEYAR